MDAKNLNFYFSVDLMSCHLNKKLVFCSPRTQPKIILNCR